MDPEHLKPQKWEDLGIADPKIAGEIGGGIIINSKLLSEKDLQLLEACFNDSLSGTFPIADFPNVTPNPDMSIEIKPDWHKSELFIIPLGAGEKTYKYSSTYAVLSFMMFKERGMSEVFMTLLLSAIARQNDFLAFDPKFSCGKPDCPWC